MAMQNEDYDFLPEATEDVLLDEPPAITSVKTNAPSPSERNKYSTPSALGKLAAENEHQFDKYGKFIASQLREMPLRSFIALQSKTNTLITTERLLCLDTEQGQSSMQRSQSPYSSGSSCSTPADLNSQTSRHSHISSDQTQGLYHQDEIGGLDILSQAMVGMCDAGGPTMPI
ncbi:hypothetical protein J6590_088385 [Homalodisca vitripennis]|nr:hypothetical protein J6590_088385 [Homalodisca vitripennis]